ncbi:MAG: hypothetical protein ACTSW1_00605 [Candidatus Hodarchaeales archaeon]
MPRLHTLICEAEKNGDIVCTGKSFTGRVVERFKIPYSYPMSNRLILKDFSSHEANRIVCTPLHNELWCEFEEGGMRVPKICVRELENGRIIEKCDAESPLDVSAIFRKLLRVERVKPNFMKFLADNDVKVVYENSRATKKKFGRELGGYARCRKKPLIEGMPAPKEIVFCDFAKGEEILAHEFAHCKEDLMRIEKGLPEAKGRWEKEYIKDEKALPTEFKWKPIGHEARASHFEERMRRKLV